jgi:ankyrin repeat protein
MVHEYRIIKIGIIFLLIIFYTLFIHINGNDNKQKSTYIPPSDPKSLANQHLLHASVKGLLSEVKKAISKGANINIKDDSDGNTAVMWASKYGYKEIVEYLILKKAKINIFNRDKTQSALLLAVFNGHLDIIQLLVTHGADIEQENIRGDNSLIIAAYKGYDYIITYLLSINANLHHITKTNLFSVLHFAAYKGHVNIVQILLENNIDVSLQDNSGRTALMLAAIEGNYNVIEALLPYISNDILNTRDNQGYTALMLAILYDHEEVANLLINANCDVNMIVNPYNINTFNEYTGDTALHIAIKKKNIHIVRLLLLSEADIMISNTMDMNALSLAKHQGVPEIYTLLLANTIHSEESDL